MDTCPKCKQTFASRYGSATVSAELDAGSESVGAGSHARVTLCMACARGVLDEIVSLVQAQAAQSAEAR